MFDTIIRGLETVFLTSGGDVGQHDQQLRGRATAGNSPAQRSETSSTSSTLTNHKSSESSGSVADSMSNDMNAADHRSSPHLKRQQGVSPRLNEDVCIESQEDLVAAMLGGRLQQNASVDIIKGPVSWAVRVAVPGMVAGRNYHTVQVSTSAGHRKDLLVAACQHRGERHPGETAALVLNEIPKVHYRKVRLPSNVDVASVSAALEGGVIDVQFRMGDGKQTTVTVPVVEAVGARMGVVPSVGPTPDDTTTPAVEPPRNDDTDQWVID
jgi:HSP20 family molecular chaperone IbpA